MRVAVIGSRGLTVDNLGEYLPEGTHEIISGGAKGVDTDAAFYAKEHHIALTEIHPDYERYKRGAPLRRNLEIVAQADQVLAFWDGYSKGTLYVIEQCRKKKVPIRIFLNVETIYVELEEIPEWLQERLSTK